MRKATFTMKIWPSCCSMSVMQHINCLHYQGCCHSLQLKLSLMIILHMIVRYTCLSFYVGLKKIGMCLSIFKRLGMKLTNRLMTEGLIIIQLNREGHVS